MIKEEGRTSMDTVPRRRLIIGIVSALLMVACGTDPRSVRITDTNKDTFLEDMKDMKGLTVGEVGLLISDQMRIVLSGDVSGDGEKAMVGKTVGELLTQLKKEAAELKVESKR